jgi:lanthanide-dependent methanol dehydrogenase
MKHRPRTSSASASRQTRASVRHRVGLLAALLTAPIGLAVPAFGQQDQGQQQDQAQPPPQPGAQAQAQQPPSQGQAKPTRGAAGNDLQAMSSDDTQWVMPPKNYANTRYSGLDQINTQNVHQLQVAWTFSLGVDRGQEAAPLIVDGTMYVVAPYAGPHPNRVFALHAATGVLIWSYTPRPNLSAEGVACCDVVNRGLAYDNGKIFLNTLDMHTVAIDAQTGVELWVTKLGDINRGETITMAPLVVRGKVLVGNSGGELGVRGWLTALDENTGKIAWRAYSTGPDQDVLIGPDFKPAFDWMRARISASRAGRLTPGRSAAAPSGVGSPTIPISI